MGRIRNYFLGEPYQPPTVDNFVPAVEQRAMTAPSRSATVVNETTALSLVPVTRSISVLETAMMQIPVDVTRGTEVVDTPSWLVTPDIENKVSQSEFLGQTVVSLALWGNAFWRVYRGPRGVSNLRLIPSHQIVIETADNGTLRYLHNGRTLSANEIVHIKLWAIPGEVYGQGPLQRHRSTIIAALDLQNYADNWFKTSAVPTGILTTQDFLSADVAAANKEAFINSQQDRTVAVLSSGLSYAPVALSPEEAQFLENQKHIARQIANMFGVPSLYLGLSIEGQGMTYVNGNEDRRKLYEDGLQTYIVRIEQAINDLLPRGQAAKFNLTEFLRPNELNRYQGYAIGLDKKFITVDEVRKWEGLPEISGQTNNDNTIDNGDDNGTTLI